MRGATLFSGGGGVEARLKDLIDFRYAVEYDPAIAAVYRANHGDHIQVARVEDVDYSTWGALDYLHASPVCKEFSQAKTGGIEGDGDISSALAVVRCLEATQPRVVTLENVGGYARSESYRLICQALDRGGYMWHAEVLNSADFGVAQTRRRLILRAVRDSLLPGLPAPAKWVGWYAAIEDLIPGLPDSKFADWQLARLPGEMNESLLLDCMFSGSKDEQGNRAATDRKPHEPAMVVTATSYPRRPMRAFIVAQGCYGAALVTAPHDAPVFAVTANSNQSNVKALLTVGDGDRSLTTGRHLSPSPTVSSANGARAWLSQGRVVKMTARALARFQSLPDSYLLPDRSSLACTIIGNAVPSLLMREIVRPLL